MTQDRLPKSEDGRDGVSSPPRRKLLVLHGNRQTGQLLLGRMDKLRKKLLKRFNIEMVAPDAPFLYSNGDGGEESMRTWWHRSDGQGEDPNHYQGLEESMRHLERIWNNHQHQELEGILGFSQGARLAHLIASLSSSSSSCLTGDSSDETTSDKRRVHFPNLQYIILVSGYDAPLPSNYWDSVFLVHQQHPSSDHDAIPIPSLHVWGERDALITPEQSSSVLRHYHDPASHVHDGGHHVPMRAANVDAYLKFIENATRRGRLSSSSSSVTQAATNTRQMNPRHQNNDPYTATVLKSHPVVPPDEETMQAQQDEVEALQAIFPDEFTLLTDSSAAITSNDCPIAYEISLPPTDAMGTWPPHPLALRVTYPPNYPTEVGPELSFRHDNNMLEFNSAQIDACRNVMQEAAAAELGMPCVLSCVYAARDFFESGGMLAAMSASGVTELEKYEDDGDCDNEPSENDSEGVIFDESSLLIQNVSPERIRECNLQGLEIARGILDASTTPTIASVAAGNNGGVWKYTIGLVGKPSAGKSTFFNASTGFARQRDDADNALGGATMAPHPFTTIDPNVGYCLIPAPKGSCPEEAHGENYPTCNVACTHGRDNKGRRLIPVMLKDVAGLVPGAYQGRGRGNKFLNDLTDADVLIHVVDASGTADAKGNSLGASEGGPHPLDDLAWIHNELIQWVYANLMFKWDSIRKRGQGKLSDMFSGYGQNQATTWSILSAVEKYIEQIEHRDHALDHLEEWDQGDVHRLVSAFLGVRFPMALSLNKSDLPSAAVYVHDIQEALPIHGAHVGVPLSARGEMEFVRHYLTLDDDDGAPHSNGDGVGTIPAGVWQCLQSAVTIREPVLVFPVSDMSTYAPLSAMFCVATQDASLPNAGMVRCLLAANGCAPTLWKNGRGGGGYATTLSSSTASEKEPLRDVLVMKPGSTVEDVFVALKKLGALGGEFVRAECASCIGDKPKPIPKHDRVGRHNRILKIMTNKRREWQNHKD